MLCTLLAISLSACNNSKEFDGKSLYVTVHQDGWMMGHIDPDCKNVGNSPVYKFSCRKVPFLCPICIDEQTARRIKKVSNNKSMRDVEEPYLLVD